MSWKTLRTQEPCFERADAFRRARAQLRPRGDWFHRPLEAEGGCGVTGFACTLPVGGRHIYEPSIQMRNRGNGKGGGIAACGLVAADHGVSPEVLNRDYILQIALLDPEARGEAEKTFVEPCFDIDQGGLVPTLDDYRDVPLLEARPPDVVRYFVQVKPDVLDRFASEKGLFPAGLSAEEAADEFVYQNSVRLNQQLYASLGEKRAFVLSHSRNLLVMKIVGYAEAAVQYYRMPDMRAHVWIAHQRYPTKGRVWHPGGAHPFVGLNEALVHNGDFANYHSVSEYLAQRNIFPQFLTDTEVSVLLFDLWARVYRQIQATHIHGSPDGPWFFIVARSLAKTGEFQLIGITDTAMLRPQVFALQEGDVSVGLICSEKQAIDATLASLASEDKRFTPIADAYWNARGGSHTDGGAFVLTISPADGSTASNGNDGHILRVTDKFGRPVVLPADQVHCDLSTPVSPPASTDRETRLLDQAIGEADPQQLFDLLCRSVIEEDYNHLRWLVSKIANRTAEKTPSLGIEALTLGIDRRYSTGEKKRSSVLTILRAGLEQIFEGQPLCHEGRESSHRRATWDSRDRLRSPLRSETALLIDARGFQPEGPDSDASLAKRAYALGWRRLIHYNSRGTRFHAAGFGPDTEGLRVDCYDNPGDYLASGMDGLECHVHGNAQDQLGQITKRGKLVVYGDVGQTFLYGAKGGEFYVLGNAAGRPMINAVGRPRVVINGTALDFLAESFMAGDPHNGGGFAILNGVRFDGEGRIVPLELPYPGSNLLSLASGGAIYLRDPHRKVKEDQLNGGAFVELSLDDWALLEPYLLENERLFGIRVEDLLSVDGDKLLPQRIYRKIEVGNSSVLRDRENR